MRRFLRHFAKVRGKRDCKRQLTIDYRVKFRHLRSNKGQRSYPNRFPACGYQSIGDIHVGLAEDKTLETIVEQDLRVR